MAVFSKTPRSPYELGVVVPSQTQYVVRTVANTSVEQRTKVQQDTEFNIFSFPAKLLICDFLSDSGSSSMTDAQWSVLFRGDESYGRNTGYYCLLDAFRDTFERGDSPSRLVDKLFSPTNEELAVEALTKHLEADAEQGGFFNSGKYQLARPNCFITPQGRCAEHLLFSTIAEITRAKDDSTDIFVPSNGFFDTTEAHAHVNRIHPVSLMDKHILDPFPVADMWHANPFKGNIDIERLVEFFEQTGAEKVPMILLTITNNTGAGQPVSMANIKETKSIGDRYNVPLFFDACRFAENARFIQEFEEGYKDVSIRSIVKEMFSYVDGFTISLKKDGLANIGGMLCIRDQGRFHTKFTALGGRDVGVSLKEKQILLYGNDSYGGMSGRDIVAASVGLYEIVKTTYLRRRINQTRMFAEELANEGIPVILPAGGHAVYIDMTRFFEGIDNKLDDFMGVGFCIELLRLYGIRACELGPFAFEWDQKNDEERQAILNLVRFAVPRNVFNNEHISYTVAAVKEIYRLREMVPRVRIVRGQELHLRHFQAALQPIYPTDHPSSSAQSNSTVSGKVETGADVQAGMKEKVASSNAYCPPA